jgi:hypothetical protein
MTAAVSTPQTNAPATPPAASTQTLSHAARIQAIAMREQAEAPAPQAAAEGEPGEVAEAAPPVAAPAEGTPSEAASDAAAEAPKEPAAEQTKEEKNASARFAALAREKKASIEREAQIEARDRMSREQHQQREQQIAARQAEIERREAKVRDWEEAGHKLLADDPKQLFDHLAKLGIDTEEKLRSVAQGKWAEVRAKATAPKEPDDPKKRPMTREEWEKAEEERETARTQKANYERAVDAYESGFKEEMHEAAVLLYDRDKRVSLGNQIADRLRSAGKPVNLDDVREAVNTLAEQDARWQSILKKRAPPSASASTGKPATQVAPNAAASTRPPTSPRAPSLSNDAVSESSAPATGAKTPETRKQRLKRLTLG